LARLERCEAVPNSGRAASRTASLAKPAGFRHSWS
jgi:hypothetical protein